MVRRLTLLVLLALPSGCHRSSPLRAPDTLVRLADDEAKSLDPQAVSDLASLRVAADQFEGLTRFDGDGLVEPGLAAGWSNSADGRIWRFHLRDQLRFSDGTPITPQTFVAGFARLRNPEIAAPTRALFKPITTMEALGRDVIVTLRAPAPELPALLAQPALAALPLHRAHWLSERPMVTSGAYRLTEWALNDHITLVRNPAWHDGEAQIAHIRWQPVPDTLSALRQFEAGAADITADFPSSRLASLRAEYGQGMHVAPYNGSYYFVFNTRRPPFNDVRVRRALNLAVDREWIAKSLLNIGNQPAYGVVPPGVGDAPPYMPDWAAAPLASRFTLARRLLTEAGYGPNHPLRFDIRFNSDVEHRRVAVALAAMWRPLNVEVNLLNSEAALHFAALRRGDFSLARSGWIGDIAVPENYLDVYRSDAGATNYSGYANPRFDATLNQARLIAAPAQRARAMREAEAMVMADAPVIPIDYYVSKSLVARRVGGWHDNPAHIHPSRTLWINR